MFSKKLLLLATIIFFTSLYTLAQDADTVIVENEEGVKDTVIIDEDEWDEDDDNWDEDDDNWDDWDDDWEDFHWDFDFMGFHGKPAISIDYGLSKMMLHDFDSKFADPVLIEGKMGYASETSYFNGGVVEYSYKFVRISNISTELTNKDFDDDELESNLWRFGFGNEGGYGWRIGQSAITPYYAYGFDWSRLEMKEFPSSELLPVFLIDSRLTPENKVEIMQSTPEEDTETLKRYHDAFRFGSSTEAGIKFRIYAGITLGAAYERSIIFERHLFWKWAGSAIIEVAAQGLLDEFIEEIGDASPYALPIMNFVLKNALSYGIYELRQEKMNWPFPSAPPLSYDQFKFGLTFVF